MHQASMSQEPVICDVCKRKFKNFQGLKVHLGAAIWWKPDPQLAAAHQRLRERYRGLKTKPSVSAQDQSAP